MTFLTSPGSAPRVPPDQAPDQDQHTKGNERWSDPGQVGGENTSHDNDRDQVDDETLEHSRRRLRA